MLRCYAGIDHARNLRASARAVHAAGHAMLPTTSPRWLLRIFKDEHTLHANNTTLMLKHYQPAHTGSRVRLVAAKRFKVVTIDECGCRSG
jgi:hypothetical protein